MALRGQRAGGVGGLSAGRIFKAVEVNNQLAGLIKAVIGQWSMKKTRCLVGGLRAGFVAQNEKKHLIAGAFKDWLKSEPLAVESDLGDAGSGKLKSAANHRGDFSMWGGVKRVHAALTLNWGSGGYQLSP